MHHKHACLCHTGVWNFADGSTAEGSSTLAYGHDSLHVEDLGVTKNIIKHIATYLVQMHGMSQAAALKVCQRLDSRLRLMPRWEDSPLPANKYFEQCGQIQAKEHRSVLQVLPHLLNGLLDDDYVLLACRWVRGARYTLPQLVAIHAP
jgi:hypothetical protein